MLNNLIALMPNAQKNFCQRMFSEKRKLMFDKRAAGDRHENFGPCRVQCAKPRSESSCQDHDLHRQNSKIASTELSSEISGLQPNATIARMAPTFFASSNGRISDGSG